MNYIKIFSYSFLLAFTAFILIACGQEGSRDTLGAEIYSQGMLAEVEGEVVVLNTQDEQAFCESNFCEPNYIYSIHLGFLFPDKKKPSPAPSPAPVPVPAPPVIPVTPPPSQPIAEQMDYSRSILEMPYVWENISQGDEEVIVAVVDTGVEYTHPDLKNNIWVNQREKSGSPGVDDDGNGYVDDVYGWDFANNRPNGLDDNRHGTHVAGIIAAEKNNIGIIGIAPKVKIMPVKFLDSRGYGSTEAAIKSIDYAVANGAQIISNSWGGGGRSELLDQAIQRAHAKGIIVVAAAGNESTNNDSSPSYPAGYSGVISVASTDQSDSLSSFSNYGKNTVLIAAPGSNILSTVTNSGWGTLSGTSMATPQVSGALALALSVNRGVNSSTLKSVMCSSAVKIHLNYVKCGRINIKNMLLAL